MQFKRHSRRSLIAALAASVALTALPVATTLGQENYPERTVRLIVAYAPGASTDTMARLVAEFLTTEMGQPVVVENKPGAASIVGTDFVVKSPADGYTLLYSSLPVLAELVQQTPYNVMDDLEPVALTTSYSPIVVVPAQMGITDLKGLVDAATASPGALNYATPGAGVDTHILLTAFFKRYGMELEHIPYPGTAAAMADAAADRAQVAAGSYASVSPFLQDQQLVPVAMYGTRDLPMLPDVPTFVEAGYGDFVGAEFESWNAIMAPAGVPTEILEKLNVAINKALVDPAISQRISELGLNNISGPGLAETQSFVQQSSEDLRQVVGELGLLVE